MGAGDKKPTYTPSYQPIRDDVIGKQFAAITMRSCPHPKVVARFGVGGTAMVSIYTCKRCHHHTEFKWHGGIGCNYGLEQGVPPGEKG